MFDKLSLVVRAARAARKPSGSMLSEKRIKCLLLDALLARADVRAIGVEVPFLSGRRWADVLVITADKRTIVFEIKSDRDSLRRMANQLSDYVRTFNQVYAVFSEKYRGNPALKRIPRSVGIAFVDRSGRSIEFTREAAAQTRLAKRNLLFFLWRKDFEAAWKDRRMPAEVLRRRLGRRHSVREIERRAVDALLTRYESRYKTFCRERSERVLEEDLDYLTKTFGGIVAP